MCHTASLVAFIVGGVALVLTIFGLFSGYFRDNGGAAGASMIVSFAMTGLGLGGVFTC